MRIDRCILVGCGGIGSLLAEPLARLLAFHDDGAPALCLVDGDVFEPGNAARQMFDPSHEGTHKCVSVARRLAPLSGVAVDTFPEYLDTSAAAEMLDTPGHTLIILSVDNAATHKACLDASDIVLKRRKLASHTILRPGNGAGGRWGLVSVNCYAVRRGQRLNGDPRVLHPEIGAPGDRIPGGGCAAVVASEPQRLASNALAMAMTLAYVTAILDGREWPDEWMAELGPDAAPLDRWRGGPSGPMAGP